MDLVAGCVEIVFYRARSRFRQESAQRRINDHREAVATLQRVPIASRWFSPAEYCGFGNDLAMLIVKRHDESEGSILIRRTMLPFAKAAGKYRRTQEVDFGSQQLNGIERRVYAATAQLSAFALLHGFVFCYSNSLAITPSQCELLRCCARPSLCAGWLWHLRPPVGHRLDQLS